MLVTLPGRVMLCKYLHPINSLPFILVTPSGRVMLRRPTYLENA